MYIKKKKTKKRKMPVQKTVLHYPTLKTVLMVEKVIKEGEAEMTREEIKRELPVKIMHQTLNMILEYLEEKGLIWDTHKGIIWTQKDNIKLQRAIEKGTEV